jgi:hypothetical protein
MMGLGQEARRGVELAEVEVEAPTVVGVVA